MTPTTHEADEDPAEGEEDFRWLDYRDFFVGPNGENLDFVQELVIEVIEEHRKQRKKIQCDWENVSVKYKYSGISESRLRKRIKEKLENLNKELENGTPIFSPHYVAHMLSDPIFLSIVGKFAGDLWCQNNIDEEVSEKTTLIERKVIRLLQEMVHYNPFKEDSNEDGRASWGRLTGCGTTANLDALCMARNKTLLAEQLLLSLQKNNIDLREECEAAGIPQEYIENGLPKKASALLKTVAKKDKIYSVYWESVEELKKKEERCIDKFSGKNDISLIELLERQPAVISTKEAHYSIRKCTSTLGLGLCEKHIIETNEYGRMDKDALYNEINTVLDNGSILIAVVATLGTTELGAVDPLHEMLGIRERIHKERGEWFLIHADAAWGAPLRLLKKYPYPLELEVSDRGIMEVRDKESMEAFDKLYCADSITFDPHKLLCIVYPAGAVLYKDGRDRHLLGVNAPYLWAKKDLSLGKNSIEGSRPCSSATAVWLTLEILREIDEYRLYQMLFYKQLFNTRYLYARLKTLDNIEVLKGPPQTNLLCFRLVDSLHCVTSHPNELNEEFYKILNPGNRGKFIVSRSENVAGEDVFAIRVVPINPFLTKEYLDRFIEEIKEKAVEVLSRFRGETPVQPSEEVMAHGN